MTAAPPAPDLPNAPARREFYRAAMYELVAMTLDVARLVHKEILDEAASPPEPAPSPEAAPAPAPDKTLRFDRIGRGLRQSITLADRLERPARAPREDLDFAPDRTTARKRIIRSVEDRIGEAVPEPDAQILQGELIDRLDDPDIDDYLLTRPIPDIVNEFCRDLGIAPGHTQNRYKRRTPYDIAFLQALAARAPLSPTPFSSAIDRHHQRPDN